MKLVPTKIVSKPAPQPSLSGKGGKGGGCGTCGGKK